jgi:ferric-dicitrate binding protein FerR (iron transport regulator)
VETNHTEQEDKEIQRVLKLLDMLELNRIIDVNRHWRIVARQIAWMRYRRNMLHFTRDAAAILCIPLLVAAYVLLQQSKQDALVPVEQIELVAAYGQVTKTTLPDQSEVWLNSGSKLIYPQRFTGEKRTVQLIGEAYFKVKADKNQRFDVALPEGLLVSAYGTEFNISAYPEDSRMEMTLAEGQLEVTSPGQANPSALQPAQQASYSKATQTMELSVVSVYATTAWKDEKIVFRRAGMAEIAEKLSRHFNVNIELKGKEIAEYEYSATFTTESIGEILHLLEKSAPIRCKIIEPKKNQDLTFSKRTVIIQMKN